MTRQKMKRVRRVLLRWTQAELAAALGISVDHYARLERGDAPLRLQTILAIHTVVAAHTGRDLP